MKRTFFFETLCLIHDAPGIMLMGMLTEELGESVDVRSAMMRRALVGARVSGERLRKTANSQLVELSI